MAGRVTALHHVQLGMPAGGEERATRFYQGLLGLPRVAKPPGLSRDGAWFVSGSLRVHLGVDPAFIPARKAHPGLLVDNLDALVATLTDAGIDVTWDDKLAGFRRVYVDDPFGNRLELAGADDVAR